MLIVKAKRCALNKNTKSETMLIASSLFSIFHKATSIRKPNLINVLPRIGDFMINNQ